MALRLLTLALAFSIVFTSAKAKMAPSPSYYSVKSSVFCVDCSHTYNYTGIRVVITCDQLKKPIMATTEKDGSFEAKLALGNCLARLLGGPKQLYASQTNIVSKLIKVGNDKGDVYTTSTSLTFASNCVSLRKFGKCGEEFGSSKTVDLPVPPEYGLPPTRYYIPVLPIIGIP